MMDICQAIYAYLNENEQIRECVGNKIFPIMLPEDAPLPAIVYSPVLANYDSALQGDTGFVRQTIQFVCHDRTFKKARELSRLVKRAFQDFHGNMCGLEIQAVFGCLNIIFFRHGDYRFWAFWVPRQYRFQVSYPQAQ